MIPQSRQPKLFMRGFTLVEIMIAMTLLSMMLLLLFSSLHTVSRSWQSGMQKIGKNDDVRLVGYFIRRQIVQSIPLEWASREGRHLVFHGDHDQLTFSSSLPSYRGGGGLYIMNLRVVDSGTSGQLYLSWQRADPAGSPTVTDTVEEESRSLLADNIDAIEFTYYGRETLASSPRWFDEWPLGDMLPSLVRLKIISSTAGQDWPVMEFPIQVMPFKGHPQIILQEQRESPVI